MFGINNLQPNRPVRRSKTGGLSRQLRPPDRAYNRFWFAGVATFLVLAAQAQPAPLIPTFLPALRALPAATNAKSSAAFAEYVRATDARNNSELQGSTNLLWIDNLSEGERKRAYAALSRGEVQLEQCSMQTSGREFQCPECMIHHWEGLIFIPEAQIQDVLRVLEDYDRHADYYSPDVVRSHIESRDGERFKVFLRFRRQKVITLVLNTEHDVAYFRDSATRAHSRSSATHIAEVNNPGKRNEREKRREDDNGFLWGLETWWRMEEKDHGVYVQSEVVSLTRNIPTGLGWMIGPFVTAVPKESLTFTLEATRRAVLAQLRAKNAN
jgi:hypothetical protein